MTPVQWARVSAVKGQQQGAGSWGRRLLCFYSKTLLHPLACIPKKRSITGGSSTINHAVLQIAADWIFRPYTWIRSRHDQRRIFNTKQIKHLVPCLRRLVLTSNPLQHPPPAPHLLRSAVFISTRSSQHKRKIDGWATRYVLQHRCYDSFFVHTRVNNAGLGILCSSIAQNLPGMSSRHQFPHNCKGQ